MVRSLIFKSPTSAIIWRTTLANASHFSSLPSFQWCFQKYSFGAKTGSSVTFYVIAIAVPITFRWFEIPSTSCDALILFNVQYLIKIGCTGLSEAKAPLAK